MDTQMDQGASYPTQFDTPEDRSAWAVLSAIQREALVRTGTSPSAFLRELQAEATTAKK